MYYYSVFNTLYIVIISQLVQIDRIAGFKLGKLAEPAI